jgi:hypothetical protein
MRKPALGALVINAFLLLNAVSPVVFAMSTIRTAYVFVLMSKIAIVELFVCSMVVNKLQQNCFLGSTVEFKKM